MNALLELPQHSPSQAYGITQPPLVESPSNTQKPHNMSLLNLTGIRAKRNSGMRRSQKLPQQSSSRRSFDSAGGSNIESTGESPIQMQHLAPYHALKDIDMKDSWTIGPLSKFTYDEK